MFFTTLCFLAPCLAMAMAATPSPSTSKLNITIYYENLCPDSEKFMSMFYPIYAAMNESVAVRLNPNGKTKSGVLPNGTRTFTCEHGPNECDKNKVHACVIRNEANNSAVVKFVTCSLHDEYFNISKNSTEECAQKAGINITSIYECMNSSAASTYLYEFGVQYEDRKIASVPSVSFNDTYNQTVSAEAVANFSDVFCSFVKANNLSNEYCKSKENSATIPSVSFLTFVLASILLVKMYQ